jgi:Tol biopolymer transport system component
MTLSNTIDRFGTLAALLLAASLLLVAGTKPAEAAFSGTNGKIAFTVYGQHGGGSFHRDVYAMNPDGTGQTNLTNNPAEDFAPAFSADGKKIAFTSTRDGNQEIYIMDADGSNPTRITINGADDYNPAFSHDGTKIAFVSERAHAAGDIYVMNAAPEDATNQPQRLTNNPAIDDRPVFSPNSTKIAFQTDRDANSEIYVMDVVDTNADGNGDNPTNLTNNPAEDGDPDFSPDGSRIAFQSNRRKPGVGKYAIYTVNSSDGSGETRITRRPKRANDHSPVFSPDSSKIAVVKFGKSGPAIFTMNADGTGRTRLPDVEGLESEPAWGAAP